MSQDVDVLMAPVKAEHYAALVRWLTPLKNEADCALYDYFLEKFANLTEGQRGLCMAVLRYVASRDDPKDPWTRQEIEMLLTHEYWRESANKSLQQMEAKR